MKLDPTTDATLLALLQTDDFLMAELYEFQFLGGTTNFFTALDVPITYGGNIYLANSIRIDGLKYKIAVGLEVDEQDIVISAFPGELLGGVDCLPGIAEGLLDGAYLIRKRGFWQRNTGIAAVDFTQYDPVGVVTLFTGRVSQISKLGRTRAEVKVKSPLVLLDIDMPRNTFGPGCQWELFSPGCTLARPTFSNAFVVGSATDTVITPAGGVSPNLGADSLPYYAQGRVTFTSGDNVGLIASIDTNDATTITLRFPLNIIPATGDQFSASAGCSKTSATCTTKFANLANFRGFPRVPPVVFSV
jgi:uncharacterized phage protein (TIGR02218 family)